MSGVTALANRTKQDLTDERYRGIRPAYGYPACPDHTEKTRLFELLGARELGIDLTETFSMSPAASVSGLYFGHPKARYFNVGKLGRDQVEDYASRKGWTVAEAERWLGPNLGYEPQTSGSAGMNRDNLERAAKGPSGNQSGPTASSV